MAARLVRSRCERATADGAARSSRLPGAAARQEQIAAFARSRTWQVHDVTLVLRYNGALSAAVSAQPAQGCSC